jgi:hypothetical protein
VFPGTTKGIKMIRGGTLMPLWIEWMKENWLSLILILGIVIAIAYVIAKRKLLFYKE